LPFVTYAALSAVRYSLSWLERVLPKLDDRISDSAIVGLFRPTDDQAGYICVTYRRMRHVSILPKLRFFPLHMHCIRTVDTRKCGGGKNTISIV